MLTEVVKRYAEEWNMIPAHGQVVCGVSGGADSLALLLLLKELTRGEEKLRVVHVEHGIRGEESLRDAAFTEQVCKELGIPCRTVHVNVPEYAKRQGMGLEEAARILRYQALRECVTDRVQDRIALAHHMNDNAETLLFQLARGSGLNGLCGIRPVRKDEEGYTYIRPLLCISREEIEEYLTDAGISWCTDSTNQDISYDRNRIRGIIIPELQKINTEAVAHMNRSAGQLSDVADFLRQSAQADYARLVCFRDGRWYLDIAGLSNCHPAVRKEVLFMILTEVCGRKKDLSYVHVSQLMGLVQGAPGKYVDFPYGVRSVRESGQLVLYRKAEMDDDDNISAKSPFYCQGWDFSNSDESVVEMLPEICIPGGKATARIREFDGNFDKLSKNKFTKCFDYAKIKNGFCFRNKKPGDYLVLDSQGHRKKLQRYLVDSKIPVSRRDELLLLAQGQEILWIVGGRMGETAKVTEQTETVIEISVDTGEDENGFFKEV